MSLTLVNKLKPLKLPFGPKSILHWLADESRDGETVSFGVDYLAAMAGCGVRTVQGHLRTLESLGILIPFTQLVGRGKYPTYRINLDVFIPEPQPAKPRGLRKPPPLKPTTEEPRLPVIPRGDPPPDVQPPPAHIEIDVEALRAKRARIQALIAKAEAGERNAKWWWEKEGARAMETLEAINQIIGLDVEMEVPVG